MTEIFTNRKDRTEQTEQTERPSIVSRTIFIAPLELTKEPGTYIAFCFPNTMTLLCLSNALAVKIHVQISCFCF